MNKEEISKEDYEAYEEVKSSGVTNMYMVGTVSSLSGLDGETIKSIMTNYGYLMEKYPEVRKQ